MWSSHNHWCESIGKSSIWWLLVQIWTYHQCYFFASIISISNNMSFKIYCENIMNITFFFFLPNFYFLDTPFLNLIIHFHKKEQTKKEKEKEKETNSTVPFSPSYIKHSQTNKRIKTPHASFKHPKPLTPLAHAHNAGHAQTPNPTRHLPHPQTHHQKCPPQPP